ncbi:MAG: cytochrome c [Myxococcales bacterium]|nr:MAG: cytochrome c [Myxococcales bacterium]
MAKAVILELIGRGADHVFKKLLPLVFLILGSDSNCQNSANDDASEAELSSGDEASEANADTEVTASGQNDPGLIDPRANAIEQELSSLTKANWKKLLKSGERRYDRACGSCHPGGQDDLGPSLIGIRWSISDMYRQIRKGSGKMQPISEKRLPEKDMAAVMVYLSTLNIVKDLSAP